SSFKTRSLNIATSQHRKRVAATNPPLEAAIKKIQTQQKEAIAEQQWDADTLREQVIDSQRRRKLVHAALSKGRWHAWDYVVPAGVGERYVRHHDRFPEVERQGYLHYRTGGAS
nr:hypothetical protein [Gammaproteobacteria bacterium]